MEKDLLQNVLGGAHNLIRADIMITNDELDSDESINNNESIEDGSVNDDITINNDEVDSNKSKSEIDSSYDCTICHSLFVKPVTLLCQHTYCRQCIKIHYDKMKNDKKTPTCPLCNCGVLIPPNDNNLLVDIINLNYEEEYKQRVEESKKNEIKSDMKEDVKNELRMELFSSLMNNPPAFEQSTFYEKIKSWFYYLGSTEVFLGLMSMVLGISYLKKFGINIPYIDNIIFSSMYLWIMCMVFTGGVSGIYGSAFRLR